MNINYIEVDNFKDRIEFDKSINNKMFTVTFINKSGISNHYYRLSRNTFKKKKVDNDKFEKIFDEALEPYRQGKK